ncbi:MAG: Plug domain-containing protein [Gemmatimonas sp.]
MRVGATLLALLLVTAAGASGKVEAQVRPDSVRVVIPIPDRLRDSLRADSIRRAPATGARAAQPVVIPDSIVNAAARARRDSTDAARAGDTVKAPIARFETPKLFEFTNRLQFSREDILSSNAVNLADLLDRVPGVTSFRSGWIGGVHVASYHSDFTRIRYFLDGIELEALQAREGGVMELTDLPLWTLDELVIERAAGEVRVWMRSWSTDRTTPYTRADIFTGDLNTNGFRALFARRYRNGLVLQFGGQQAATQTGRVSSLTTEGQARGAGDGSQQTVNLRAGWSRGLLTVDMLGNVSARDRDPQTAREDFRDLAAFKGSRREAYFRVGYGDTTRGLWSQAVVNLLRVRLEGIRATSTTNTMADTAPADTIAGRTQQMLAVGYRANAWQVSLVDRIRPLLGTALHAPALRASGAIGVADAGVYAERNGVDSTRRVDLFGRVQPLPWLAVTGTLSDRAPMGDTTRVADRSMRVEGGVRVGSTWVSAGIVRTDATTFENPAILGVVPAIIPAASASGITGTVRGPVYKDVRLDVGFERWNVAQFGRPRLHVRSEVALISNWLRKFPKGQFGIDARMTFELRNRVPFLFGADSLDAELPDVRYTERVLLATGQLQIRIQRASIFYLYRNLSGSAYEQVPGLTLPPAVQMYCVRWEFFN